MQEAANIGFEYSCNSFTFICANQLCHLAMVEKIG